MAQTTLVIIWAVCFVFIHWQCGHVHGLMVVVDTWDGTGFIGVV